MRRVVEIGAFIAKINGITRHTKTVRKPRWNVKLTVIFVVEKDPKPSPKCGRAAAHIDRDIEDFSASHKYELPLWLNQLIVQAPQGPATGSGNIILYEGFRNSRIPIAISLVALEKEAASISKRFGFEQNQAGNFGGQNFHLLLFVTTNFVNPAVNIVQDPMECNQMDGFDHSHIIDGNMQIFLAE